MSSRQRGGEAVPHSFLARRARSNETLKVTSDLWSAAAAQPLCLARPQLALASAATSAAGFQMYRSQDDVRNWLVMGPVVTVQHQQFW
jgi:hypothetical protein